MVLLDKACLERFYWLIKNNIKMSLITLYSWGKWEEVKIKKWENKKILFFNKFLY